VNYSCLQDHHSSPFSNTCSRLVVGRYIESVILRRILGYNSLDWLLHRKPLRYILPHIGSLETGQTGALGHSREAKSKNAAHSDAPQKQPGSHRLPCEFINCIGGARPASSNVWRGTAI
jgi:hypothetical protein